MKVIAWIIAIPLILLGLFILMRVLMCGPNSADVKVMKPMGDAINTYLITQGKPSLLDSIPNLPYALECESAYKCRFKSKYNLKFQKWSSLRYSLDVSQSESYHTGIYYNYEKHGMKFVLVEKKYYSNKKTGICNPMKQ